jgi:hypothetical protein
VSAAILRPRYSALAFRGFDTLLAPWRATHLNRAPLPPLPTVPADRPLILVANHVSWWDGFLLRDLHLTLRPGAPMYTVMSSDELQRRPFFRLLGCVPLEPGSPSSLLALVRGLRHAVQARPDASVLYFPQGRIWPSSRRPLGFRRGIEVVMRALAPCTVLPVALHVEPLNRAAPTSFLLPASPLECSDAASPGATVLEAAVAARLDALSDVLTMHGEDAVQHIAELA